MGLHEQGSPGGTGERQRAITCPQGGAADRGPYYRRCVWVYCALRALVRRASEQPEPRSGTHLLE